MNAPGIPPSLFSSLQDFLACAIVGFPIATTVYGITFLQTYLYFRRYPQDGAALKILVGTLWLLDTLTIVFISHAIYTLLVTNLGDLADDVYLPWWEHIGILEMASTNAIGVIVQCYFARQLWKVGHGRILLPILIVLLKLPTAVLAVVTLVESFGVAGGLHFFRATSVLVSALGSAESAIALLCDVLITVGLCYYFNTSRSGYVDTNALIDRLVVYAIQRGALTAVVQCLSMISVYAFPKRHIYITFSMVIGKLYVNSLLSSLNVRAALNRSAFTDNTRHSTLCFELPARDDVADLSPHTSQRTGYDTSVEEEVTRTSVGLQSSQNSYLEVVEPDHLFAYDSAAAMTDDAPPSLLHALRDFLSCSLVGLPISTAVYGITILQTYLYFRRYPQDSRRLKTFVGTLWLLDTLTIVLICHSTYMIVIMNVGQLANDFVLPWSVPLENGATDLITVAVQCYFASQLHRLTRRKVLPGLIVLLTIPTLVSIALPALHGSSSTAVQLFPATTPLVSILGTAQSVLALVCDVLITGGLCVHFHTSRSGFAPTDALIDRLMAFAIQRAALTTFVQALSLILLVTIPDRFIFLIPSWLVGKLYINSLLASLNVRASLNRSTFADSSGATRRSTLRFEVAPGESFSRGASTTVELAEGTGSTTPTAQLDVERDGTKVALPALT
ncbi:hypothetical protein OH77DRAFT_1520244 [Trametes cingulata]|nr:hypothetical protein OH77DRAFT_1520244 [Trametes cingulata]